MEPRTLAEQLLGLPPGSLLDFKIFDDHISLILPDGCKITVTQSELEELAALYALAQPVEQTVSQQKTANKRPGRRPNYKYRKGEG
jgi:hypothetical protein